MTYERFLKITLNLKNQDERISDLYKNKVDLIDFVDPYHTIITELIKEVYGDEGYEWFAWFCYDNEYGRKIWKDVHLAFKRDKNDKLEFVHKDELSFGAKDENGNPICYDLESTWEYLEKNYKK